MTVLMYMYVIQVATMCERVPLHIRIVQALWASGEREVLYVVCVRRLELASEGSYPFGVILYSTM